MFLEPISWERLLNGWATPWPLGPFRLLLLHFSHFVSWGSKLFTTTGKPFTEARLGFVSLRSDKTLHKNNVRKKGPIWLHLLGFACQGGRNSKQQVILPSWGKVESE